MTDKFTDALNSVLMLLLKAAGILLVGLLAYIGSEALNKINGLKDQVDKVSSAVSISERANLDWNTAHSGVMQRYATKLESLERSVIEIELNLSWILGDGKVNAYKKNPTHTTD